MRDLTDWITKLKARDVSASEIIEFYLARIEALDPMLNAFLTVTHEEAKSAAKLADERLAKGNGRPWEGLPLAIKDLVDTAHVPTTAAAKITSDRVPDEDATVWQKVKEQGAILLGKLNMHEFAYGTTSENPHFGAVHNPWDVARISGGSSGGSGAAVAADLTPASIGTDTGGSIRIPSAMTGVFGLKPSYGLVSVRGVMPLAFSLDHVGPMARSVRDIAWMLEVMAGYDPEDPHSVPFAKVSYREAIGKSIQGMTAGIEEAFFMQQLDPEVAEKVREVLRMLEESGVRLKRIEEPLLQDAPGIQYTIISSETYALHEKWLTDPELPYGEDVRTRLLNGKEVRGADYANALLVRRRLTRRISGWFDDIDFFVAPVIGFPATPIGDREIQIEGSSYLIRPHLNRFTSPFNLTGLPAMSIPCGLSKKGLPLAVQLVAGSGREDILIQVSSALEKAFPFQAPPLFE